jgi:eukaryotic-like serine/threonine-protein kinase
LDAGGAVLGARVSNFEVVRLLGEGGMGAVYEGKHPVIEKRVAIKLLKPERAVDPELVQRFFNEARATSAIRHPNIVEVMDLGTLPSGAPYLVMELLEGETLGDRLERVGRLDVQVALDFARQTASALEAAHARGIVHRDLKPDNVFLVPDPRLSGRELVKVLDFGIAKLRGELVSDPVQTMAGALLGTPSYMSPEQCRGVPEQIDHRTDIYALGVMLYEMICGAPPFVADALGDTMMMHMSMPPPPPTSLGFELPEELELAILRALAKRPEERFASMSELRAALEPAPSPVVVFPAAVNVAGAARSAHALASGVRGGALVPRAPASQVERTRPVSGTATRRPRAEAAANVGAGDAAAATSELDIELAEQAASRRRDDEDTAPGDGARATRRRNAFALVALLCAAIAAAGWLLPGALATEQAPATAAARTGRASRLDPAPPPAVPPALPMSAVVAPAPAPAPALQPTTPSAPLAPGESDSPRAKARRARLDRATAEAERAASNRAAVDNASAFGPVSAGDDWQAATAESVAASAPSAAPTPASSADEPPAAADSLSAGGQAQDEPAHRPQLAAAVADAKTSAESALAPRAVTAAAAKTSAATPATFAGRVAIEDLQVRGSLPESVIRRGIDRVRANFDSCYRKAAGSGGRSAPGKIDVSFELDELGRVRNARASGSTIASLDRCVADATRHITSRRAPDTGIVRGSFQLVAR